MQLIYSTLELSSTYRHKKIKKYKYSHNISPNQEILCVLDRYYYLEWYRLVCIFVPIENEHLEVQLGLYDQQWLVIIDTNMYTQVPHHNL